MTKEKSIGKQILKFLSENIEIKKGGQGNITLGNTELWEMSDEELLKRFSDYDEEDIEVFTSN